VSDRALPLTGGVRLARPNRRELLLGGLLLGITAASLALRPVRLYPQLSHGELDAAIPKAVGPYRFATTSGLILPPRDELSDRLYDEVLTRTYLAPGQIPVMALFAYGSVQNLSLELHRPEECYPQQGFEIGAAERMPLRLDGHDIPASFLTARRPDGYVEQLLFWSRIGPHFPPDRTTQSLIVARENFAGRMPDGILVRLSLPTGDRALALRVAGRFMADLAAELPPLGRRIVFGEANRG